MTTADDFWAFSLRFYAAPQVSGLCLELQDRFGADVNILLYLLFRAVDGISLDAPAIAHLDAFARDWRTEVVKPLREVRRTLKAHETLSPPHAALRTAIKAAELDAERLEQRLLAAAAPEGCLAVNPAAAARSSVVAYLQSIGAAAGAGDALLAAFDRHPR
jgi:uncharacterized protein (TIGR02444 family)